MHMRQAGQYATFEFEDVGDTTLTRSWTLSCHPDETADTNTISITVKKVKSSLVHITVKFLHCPALN